MHGVDASSQAVLRRRLGRSKLLTFFARPPPCLIGMEACSSAHHWARELARFGHEVRLIPPQYVKPYVKRNKTDAADAEAICDGGDETEHAVRGDQDARTAKHSGPASRSSIAGTATNGNHQRGPRAVERIWPGGRQGSCRVVELQRDAMEPELLPEDARQAISSLFNHVDTLHQQIEMVEARILAWHKTSDESQRLASAPGVGPITATAIVAAVGDGRQFQSARHFAAWLGLTSRIRASGGRENIGRTAREVTDLRTLLIHGARTVVGYVPQGCGTSALAYCPRRSPAGECGCDRGRSQNSAGVVGHDGTCRDLPPICPRHSSGVTGRRRISGAGLRG